MVLDMDMNDYATRQKSLKTYNVYKITTATKTTIGKTFITKCHALKNTTSTTIVRVLWQSTGDVKPSKAKEKKSFDMHVED
jgi:hypothetical protein